MSADDHACSPMPECLMLLLLFCQILANPMLDNWRIAHMKDSQNILSHYFCRCDKAVCHELSVAGTPVLALDENKLRPTLWAIWKNWLAEITFCNVLRLTAFSTSQHLLHVWPGHPPQRESQSRVLIARIVVTNEEKELPGCMWLSMCKFLFFS